MNSDQITIISILAATVTMFLWGRWRHDMVAAGSLLTCTVFGLVPASEAFLGFGHPAVITVACVLVLSKGLQSSGAVEVLTRSILPTQAGPLLSIAALIALGAVLSSFMNNVGAMALLMPVAIQIAHRFELPPGKALMPLAFGTILGGMTTLIGTPPNLIVSGFRAETGAGGFGMFDYTPVGLAVAVAGILFVVLLGRWLVPARQQASIEGFESGAYITEAKVSKDSKAIGQSLRELEEKLEDSGAQIVGLARNDLRMTAPNPRRRMQEGDVLQIEAEADALSSSLSELGLELAPAKPSEKSAKTKGETEKHDSDSSEKDTEKESTPSEEIALVELALLPNSAMVGRSAKDIGLRTRYSVNLLAISREGRQTRERLRSAAFRSGDLLLLQGPEDAISEFAKENRCVPLAERDLGISSERKIWKSCAIMALAITAAALGLLPAAVSFAIGVLASMALRTVQPREVYEAIDWPVVILLATLIPVAGAMESTGTADLIARFLLESVAQGHAVAALALILVVTMFLSDLMNNAATAAMMCPIALGTATALGVNPDSFLMAVAIGASCAFLTPVGHQNNTLILGPGGFRFSDYWRLGLPLELIVLSIAIPLLLLVWPL